MLEKFYVDFTHRSPLSPEALAFLASHVGFESVRTEFYNEPPADTTLRPVPASAGDEELSPALNGNFRKLNRLILLPHYYSVIAFK